MSAPKPVKQYPRKIYNPKTGSSWVIPFAGATANDIKYEPGRDGEGGKLLGTTSSHTEASIDSFVKAGDWEEVGGHHEAVDTQAEQIRKEESAKPEYTLGWREQILAKMDVIDQLTSDLAESRRACEIHVEMIDALRHLVAGHEKHIIELEATIARQKKTIYDIDDEASRLHAFELDMIAATQLRRETEMFRAFRKAEDKLRDARKGTGYDTTVNTAEGDDEPARPAFVRTNFKRYRPEKPQ